MNLYCMRHGQSEYNILGLCNDEPARGVCLTARGRQQAERAREELLRAPLQRIFCSELARTRETAEIVNRERGLPIQVHAGINDIRSGCDGRPVQDYFAAIAHDRLNTRVGDGESLLQHKARVLGFLDWLGRQDYQEVLIVAHEETLRVCAALDRGLSDEDMIGLRFGNCEVVKFELPNSAPRFSPP